MEFINWDLLLRIIAAITLGFFIGLERELTNKYAGLRTHILVSLGACIFTIISIYGFPTFAAGDNVIIEQATGVRDTARIAAQIVTGIGFIGAGTVLRNGPMIIGLTTAATLWISAAIGMTCGVGMYDIAIVATVLSVAVLTVIRVFERKFIPTSIKRNKRYKITLYCNEKDTLQLREYLSGIIESTESYSSKKLIDEPEKTKISIVFELGNKKLLTEICKKIDEIKTAESVNIQELND